LTAGPQVEEVGEVRAAGDQRTVDHGVDGAAGGEGGGGQARHADAEDLHRATGDLALGQGAQVSLEPLGRRRAVQVVVGAETAAAGHGQQHGRPDPGGQTGDHRGGRTGARDEGRTLEQGDRLTPVVGPGPGLRVTDRRLSGEGRIRGTCGHRSEEGAGQGTEKSATSHRVILRRWP
jgi:hypothetical protein